MVQILRLLAALALLSASLSAQNIHWAQILSGDRQGSGAKGLSNALTSAHFFVGNGSNVATDVAISGDASVTNAGVWTNVQLNGVSFAASPSTNTVPIITASNTATYSTVPDCQDSAGNHLNYNNTTHALSCGTSGAGISTTLTSAHFFVGNVSNIATDVAISGDASVTNAGVWTNAKVNGVSFASSPSTNTVPIITASNTATYTSVPDCQDTSGNHLNYNNTTHALSCGTSAAGGSSSAPAIRGTGSQASSASSYTVTWPTGTAAGDLAIIYAAGGFVPTVPIGWTTLDSSIGSNWQGVTFWRTLNSSDIATGNVSISFSGTFDSVVSIVTFTGAASIRAVSSARNSVGSSSVTVNSDGSPLTTDMALYFGSNRGASTDTVSLGTMKQQVNDASAGSGCLYAGAPAGTGGVSPVFSYSSAGSGNYQVIVVVRAAI